MIIQEIIAFIAENEEGEGVMGFKTKDGWMPMVGADGERIKSLYGIAESIKKLTGRPFKVIKFTQREDITKEVQESQQKEKANDNH